MLQAEVTAGGVNRTPHAAANELEQASVQPPVCSACVTACCSSVQCMLSAYSADWSRSAYRNACCHCVRVAGIL